VGSGCHWRHLWAFQCDGECLNACQVFQLMVYYICSFVLNHMFQSHIYYKFHLVGMKKNVDGFFFKKCMCILIIIFYIHVK
jgi:hypothetical protein